MMNPVSNKSIFVRIKESLIYRNKALLIDKDGCLNQKETYQIYSGAINDISSLIKEGDVCLIAPFLKKETIIIIAAIVSLGGRIIVGDPQDTLENYLASINDKIDIDVLVGYQDDKWFIKKNNQSIALSLDKQELKVTPRQTAKDDEPSFYVLTSGSTGISNLVALSEYAFINHATREIDDIGPNHTCSYGCVPLNHIFGLALYLQHLITGKTIYISNSRNPSLALDMIEKYRCSAIANVPTFFNMLIEEQERKSRDISSLKYGVIAGGSYTKEQFLNIQDKLGISLCSSYGMTEASTVITNSPVKWPVEERCVGVGKPFPGVDVVFKNKDGEIVPNRGEICFKGYNLMLGYVENKKLVLPVDEDGYFHTGDIGEIDSNGVYHIVDRIKNIIIRGGENLSPVAIKNKIMSIPGIKDAYITSIPNKKYGEVVVAYLVSDIYKQKDIKPILEKVLLKHELPYLLIIEGSVPLLSNGKYDKMTIRNLFIKLDENNIV